MPVGKARTGEGSEHMATGFYWDELTFWHAGGNYADIVPVGGLVQPKVAGACPRHRRANGGSRT